MVAIDEKHVVTGIKAGQDDQPDFLSDAGTDVEVASITLATDDFHVKKKQEYSGWLLIWVAYQSVGVIYGDIGTSPLYVFSSTFRKQPSYNDLLGALSIIIWSLTIMVTIKYVCIVLLADDDGEGGTFALYSKLIRYIETSSRDRDAAIDSIEEEKAAAHGLASPKNAGFHSFMEGSATAMLLLKLMGVLGVSMVLADGILTPAQSVLGAIQGIEVIHPSISTNTIVGVSCAVIVLLFAIQPYGVHRIGSAGAPVIIVWLTFNSLCGLYNLLQHDHTVLKAFSPFYAIDYLVRNKDEGWRSLGGLLLAFTGVEAMFADLGAFSARAIRLSWLIFVYPCLLLAYIGQAAFISRDTTDAYSNPFFHTLPPHTLYFGLMIAIAAAVIASQGTITSCFQLLSQVMAMSYFPHIKTVHTSKDFHGQVYIPSANWLLMVGTLIVTVAYHDTTQIGNAYGVCVMFVMFITTCMVSIVAILIWQINIYVVILAFLVFGAFDGLYLSSALTKVPEGAWLTLLLAFSLCTIFILWRFGKEQQWSAEAADRFQTTHLFTAPNVNGEQHLTTAFGGHLVSPIQGLGIFFDKIGDMCPTVFTQFVTKLSARPEVMVFFHLRPLSLPTICPSERFLIQRTSLPYCYRVIVRHGYSDSVITPDLARVIVDELSLYITRDHRSSAASGRLPAPGNSPSVQRELNMLKRAHERQVVYVMGKEQLKIRRETKRVRGGLLAAFLWIREYSRTKMADMNLPMDELVEVGFIKEIS